MSQSLHIGIGIHIQHSFFSNGMATTAYSLAEALRALGHTPYFVNTNMTQAWFEDCSECKDTVPIRHLCQWNASEQFDIFIDIDGFIRADERRRIAKRVVVFIRKLTFLHEMERSVYPIQGPIRNLHDCDALWMWSSPKSDQDAHILALLSQKPVFQLPFTWSTKPTETHANDRPEWLTESQKTSSDHPWECHITESNQSIASSSILPLVIAAYAKTHTALPFHSCMVHNANDVGNHPFFKDNILAHCQRPGLSIQTVGRQRISDWRTQPKSWVLSHTRFLTVKTALLDAVWHGIPTIHSSPFLRDLGHGLERFYYEDNSVTGAAAAITNMVTDYTSRSGFFAEGTIEKLRHSIRVAMDPLAHRSVWDSALLFAPTQPTQPIQSTPRVITVGFSDLWQDANHTYNFWTLLLEHACKSLKTPVQIRGVKITDETVNTPIDLLFFAPFGDTWTRVPAKVPKIHITGENTPSKFGPGVVLNLGFEATDLSRGIYRFPLWIQYLDWFGADQARLQNPRSMPIANVIEPNKDIIQAKKKFCAFVVSNPSNSLRNQAFQWLQLYKPVDSAGRLYNNVGDVIFVENAGGGGGELKKLEFLQDYKFCITFENSRGDGYVTEKLLAAKAAGCIPIYWGAENVTDDFAEGSFLNMNHIQTPSDLIEAVKALDEHEDAYMAMATKPSITLAKEQARLAEVAKLILAHVLDKDAIATLPSTLGSVSSPKQIEPVRTNPVAPSLEPLALKWVDDSSNDFLDSPPESCTWNGRTLLCTFATKRFLGSLSTWLQSAHAQMNADSSISIRVYLGDDIDEYDSRVLKTEFNYASFIRVPSKTLTVEGFPDLWDPQHFAWKLWIYQQLVRERALQGTCIWYMDAGSCIIRMPNEWLGQSRGAGICLLEDPEQTNGNWCHEQFCQMLTVTPEEKAAQQVVGGIVSFLGGHHNAWNLFTEAWTFAQIRPVIVGPKWAGVGSDGKPFGHRHDQSILSILRLRHKTPVYPLYSVYNHESLRRTLKSGAALYVHRGQFKEHEAFAPKIGEVHIISLAKRADRIKRFKENHESWTKQVCLRPAYDGRRISLTPALAKLFQPNDFHWKKSVMGCALSHLSLWCELAMEPECCENYLVLEDDVKFKPGWLERWTEAAKHIPEDYDILYLGGILPPNKAMFQNVLEPVNAHWSRVAHNSIFGQNPPSRYFHFCNYAYIMSRKGAQKLLQTIGQYGGYHTSADHMICNRTEDLVHYVLTPLEATCYQDDDPKYAQSQFNDFSRIDGFDSDLWNNDERFSQTEIQSCLERWTDPRAIPVLEALQDAKHTTFLQEQPQSQPQPESQPQNKSTRWVTIGDHSLVPHALHEFNWLKECFGTSIETVQTIPVHHEPLQNHPIFIIMRPHIELYANVFQFYEAAQRPFSVLHLSDEFCKDPVDWMNFTMLKHVIRTYPRADLPCSEKVIQLPLGPARVAPPNAMVSPQRDLVWSFHGTKWMNREQLLAPWKQVGPHDCAFYDDWMAPNQLGPEAYSKLCMTSIFVLCPRGHNVETFRFYEALEHGAIPVFVREEGDDAYFTFLTKHLPIISFPTWGHALVAAVGLLNNQQTLIDYRKHLFTSWIQWKESLKQQCQSVLVDNS
jgi:GR25 family glycosyltransferase involved in LPS biosynthesis